jgi:hypothetical protein
MRDRLTWDLTDDERAAYRKVLERTRICFHPEMAEVSGRVACTICDSSVAIEALPELAECEALGLRQPDIVACALEFERRRRA